MVLSVHNWFDDPLVCMTWEGQIRGVVGIENEFEQSLYGRKIGLKRKHESRFVTAKSMIA